jgi:uncharacterized membrane protein
MRETEFSSSPIWLRPYLTVKVKTLFPLFPWSAFLISGTLIGVWFLKARESSREREGIMTLATFSALAILIALLFEILPSTFYPHHDFWNASPEFFFVRLGIIILCLSGLWWYEQRKSTSSRSLTLVFGQESLLVYVAHLLIVYGQDYDWSLMRYYGTSLNYLECFGIFAGLAAMMVILAYSWYFLKGWNKKTASILQFAFLAGVMLKFLLK